MKNKILLICLISIFFLSGCGCEKKPEKKPKEKEIINIENIIIETPMGNIESIEYKPGNNEYVTIKTNTSFEFITLISPTDAKKEELEWRVVDSEIISVDNNGIVTTNKVGKTSVYVIVKNNPKIKSNTVEIEVIPE